MSITVLKAGFQDLIQDLGRNGYTHLGISPSGAADKLSFRIANLLLGNNLNDSAIEITLFGGTYHFNKDTTIVMTGSEFKAIVDDKTIPFFKPIYIKKGQKLSIGATTSGARCYLAIKGGFQLQPVLKSTSTHLLSKIGGLNGENIKKNDKINYYTIENDIAPNLKFNIDSDRSLLRVTKGLQFDLFDNINRRLFFNKKFTMSHNSNRMGLRTSGPKISKRSSTDILTEGLPLGAIQVTGNGDAIITFVDHQTTGGYPKIANIIAADLHKVGQLKPGDRFMFKLVSLSEAETFYFEQEKSLNI